MQYSQLKDSLHLATGFCAGSFLTSYLGISFAPNLLEELIDEELHNWS